MFKLKRKLSIAKCLLFFLVATGNCDDTNKVPKIDPEEYVDDGKLLLKFSCEANLEIGDKLSWIMTRDNKKDEEQLNSHKATEKSNNYKLKLEHQLKPEDNNAVLVCVVDDKSGTKTSSKKVTIVFKSATSDDTKKTPKITPETYDDNGKLLLQFSCEANLEKEETLSWFFTRNEKEPLSEKYVEVEKSKNVKYDLEYQLKPEDNNAELVCIKDSKSGTKTRSNTVSIVFKPATNTEKPKINMDPVITPETYVDDGKPFLEFSCEAYLEKEDQLSWKITRNGKDETIALYKELEERRTKILDLQYPLDQKDDKAEIVCTKQYKNGNKVPSNIVPIVITKAKLPETRNDKKVFVWPQKNTIIYNDTTPVPLACWGYLDATNKAQDTSLYVTWYQIHGSTRPERITMLPQENTFGYVKLEMMKIFTPSIDDETQIYCATEQMSITLKTTPVEKSDLIKLLHFPSAPVCYPFDHCMNVTSLGWAVAAVLVVLAILTLVGLLVAIFSLCCRGDRKCENDTQESNK